MAGTHKTPTRRRAIMKPLKHPKGLREGGAGLSFDPKSCQETQDSRHNGGQKVLSGGGSHPTPNHAKRLATLGILAGGKSCTERFKGMEGVSSGPKSCQEAQENLDPKSCRNSFRQLLAEVNHVPRGLRGGSHPGPNYANRHHLVMPLEASMMHHHQEASMMPRGSRLSA